VFNTVHSFLACHGRPVGNLDIAQADRPKCGGGTNDGCASFAMLRDEGFRYSDSRRQVSLLCFPITILLPRIPKSRRHASSHFEPSVFLQFLTRELTFTNMPEPPDSAGVPPSPWILTPSGSRYSNPFSSPINRAGRGFGSASRSAGLLRNRGTKTYPGESPKSPQSWEPKLKTKVSDQRSSWTR
jgi:hypothetical protein